MHIVGDCPLHPVVEEVGHSVKGDLAGSLPPSRQESPRSGSSRHVVAAPFEQAHIYPFLLTPMHTRLESMISCPFSFQLEPEPFVSVATR